MNARSKPQHRKIIAQRHERHVHAVGDEADVQPIGQTQHALNDIVVPRQRHRTAVAQVSEERQAGVDAGPQFVERRIAMAGRNANALLDKDPRDARAWVAFRRERDDPRQAAGRVEQPLHRVDIGRPGVCRRMRADVAGLFIEKRALDVDAPNHVAIAGSASCR